MAPLGEWKESDWDFHLNKVTADDGSPVYAIFHFRALDSPRDIRNLLSLELTGCWFNELREIEKSIFDGMTGRVDRWPKKEEGCGGATWAGIIGDTNPPDTDSWIYDLFEVKRPRYCRTCKDSQGGIVLFDEETRKCLLCGDEVGLPFTEVFHQPSGRGPDAENLPNLVPGYYARLAAGKDKDFIKVYVDGDYGYVKEGKPVFPQWDDDKHVSPVPLKGKPGFPLIIAFDNSGRDQAAVIMQYWPTGQLAILHEFLYTDTGTRTLVNQYVKPFVYTTYPGAQLILTGDPAGVRRNDTDDRDSFMEIEEAFKIMPTPARSNALSARFNAVDSFLTKFLGGKKYGLTVSPTCSMVIRGMRGEYRLRRMQIVGRERYTDKPEKNLVSHIMDAVQYGCMAVEDMGGREGTYLIPRTEIDERVVISDAGAWEACT
jgi:hypothetical protein